MHWTDEMDARLTEGVAQHKAQGWARVAEFMGEGMRAGQCRHRWDYYLEPRRRGLKHGNWQPDEVRRLLMLVPLYTDMKRDRIDWTAIGWELDRVPTDCRDKHKLMQESKMKKGHFTAEEDALICQRVREWGDKGNGLWVALEKEMDRARVNIRGSWIKRINRRK